MGDIWTAQITTNNNKKNDKNYNRSEMGQVCSSSEKEEEKYVFETSNIYFDEYGNLKYDKGKKPVDREAEMRRIMETEESEVFSGWVDVYVRL